MTLQAITGMPIIAVGHANRLGSNAMASALTNNAIAATNDAVMMIGKVHWEDGGSHTIDTTGSSSIQWRTGTATFANAGTTVKVGVSAVDATNGPPVRAVNSSNLITFDVAAVFTGGGGGITASAWQTSVPTTGSKTIANGDLVAVSMQMTVKAGSDSVNVSATNMQISSMQPTLSTITFTSSYSNTLAVPNCVLVASDGTRGYIFGGFIASSLTSQSWSNTSAKVEYGNILRFPFPTRAYGIIGGGNLAVDTNLILYGTPLGTPSALATIAAKAVQVGQQASTNDFRSMFASPVDLSANTDYGIIAAPQSASNTTMIYKSYNDANHQNSDWLGTDCYAINRASGAFASQNSNKDRFAIGLLVGAFDGGGGAAGLSPQPLVIARGTPY
jgi:hypothetical protein